MKPRRNPMNIRGWHYSGDVCLEQGGFYYKTKDVANHYADAVRIVPCSDAGGPDNEFWIEALTIILPENEADLSTVLCSQGDNWPTMYVVSTKANKAHMLIQACEGYGKYDVLTTWNVRIGKPGHMGGVFAKAKIEWTSFIEQGVHDVDQFRAGTSLETIVRRFMAEEF